MSVDNRDKLSLLHSCEWSLFVLEQRVDPELVKVHLALPKADKERMLSINYTSITLLTPDCKTYRLGNCQPLHNSPELH
jgi:hypothetical protein